MKPPVIHPYVEIDAASQRVLDRFGFYLTDMTLVRTAESWLCLRVDWNATKGESWKVKRCRDAGNESSSGGGRESQGANVEFAPITMTKPPSEDWHPSIALGIYIKTGRQLNPPRLGYRLQFVEHVKWGCLRLVLAQGVGTRQRDGAA